MLEWVQFIFGLGLKVYEAFKGGATTIRVEDVLPEQYRDRVRLQELAAKAERDYMPNAGTASNLPPPSFAPIVLDLADRTLDGFSGTNAEAVELADAMSTRARERLAAALRRDDI
jgi:hypothetical protein